MRAIRTYSCPGGHVWGTNAIVSLIIAAAFFVSLTRTAIAQSPVISLKLGQDQIGLVKTAQGISTKISFREIVTDIICGDLYDPTRGTGSFVVQKLDKDVFIKPVTSKSISNMFVKTGENGEFTYSFDLVIVPVEQAYRIVNTVSPADRLVEAKTRPQPVRRLITVPPMISTIPAVEVGPGNMTGAIPDNLPFIASVGAEPPAPPAPAAIPTKEKSNDATTDARTNQVAVGGEPTKRVIAAYPEYAKQLGLSGPVVVEVTVDEKGKVIAAKAISGNAFLREAAVNAARGWRFEPTLVAGSAVKTVGQITFNFERFSKNRNGSFNAVTGFVIPQWGNRRRPPY